jgi:hypothetical protein
VFRVLIARHTSKGTELLTNRTDPSMKPTFTPPLW